MNTTYLRSAHKLLANPHIPQVRSAGRQYKSVPFTAAYFSPRESCTKSLHKTALVAMNSPISLTLLLVLYCVPRWTNSKSLLKSLSVLERSITPRGDLCDLVTVSQREERVIEDLGGANQARPVYSHRDALRNANKETFAFSQCLILVAGSGSNITHLVGVGKKLQFSRPLAMVVGPSTIDLRIKERLRQLHTSFPLLLMGGGNNNGELELCKRRENHTSHKIFFQKNIF